MSGPIYEKSPLLEVYSGLASLKNLTPHEMTAQVESLVNRGKVKLKVGETQVTFRPLNDNFKSNIKDLSEALDACSTETAKEVKNYLIIGEFLSQFKKDEMIISVSRDAKNKDYYISQEAHKTSKKDDDKVRNFVKLDSDSRDAITEKAEEVSSSIQAKIKALTAQPDQEKIAHTTEQRTTIQSAKESSQDLQPKELITRKPVETPQEAAFKGWKRAMERQKDDDSIDDQNRKREAEKKSVAKGDQITDTENKRQERRRKGFRHDGTF